MEYFGKGWEILSKQLVPWILVVLVFGLVAAVTCGIGGLLFAMNLYRQGRRHVIEGQPPEIGGLFSFDHVGEDIVMVLLLLVANLVCSLVPVVGAIIAAGLFLWAPIAYVDGRFSPVDAMMASVHHVKDHVGPVFIFAVLVVIANIVGAILCGIGTLVTAPLTMVATWAFYADERESILAAARAAGVTVRG